MPQRPFKIDGQKPRGADGRFARDNATPENPLDDPTTPDKWAPGIGQNSAETSGQKLPWPPAQQTPKPMKVG